MAYIRAQAGQAFDPSLVPPFAELMPELLRIWTWYPDSR